MSSVVEHGATTFFVDDAESIYGACSVDAVGRFLERIDRSVDVAYLRLHGVRGERSVIVLVNIDRRICSWLMHRSGDPVESPEITAVVDAVMHTEPVDVRTPIGFASHFAVGGAPLHVNTLDVLPSDWERLFSAAAHRPESMAEFFDLFWSSHV
jgi:hypothetical protein